MQLDCICRNVTHIKLGEDSCICLLSPGRCASIEVSNNAQSIRPCVYVVSPVPVQHVPKEMYASIEGLRELQALKSTGDASCVCECVCGV